MSISTIQVVDVYNIGIVDISNSNYGYRQIIVDIQNSNCGCQQLELLISTIWTVDIVDIHNLNCWYRQFQLRIISAIANKCQFGLPHAWVWLEIGIEVKAIASNSEMLAVSENNTCELVKAPWKRAKFKTALWHRWVGALFISRNAKQSAALPRQVVCLLSICAVHIGWNTLKIISPLISPVSSVSAQGRRHALKSAMATHWVRGRAPSGVQGPKHLLHFLLQLKWFHKTKILSKMPM